MFLISSRNRKKQGVVNLHKIEYTEYRSNEGGDTMLYEKNRGTDIDDMIFGGDEKVIRSDR